MPNAGVNRPVAAVEDLAFEDWSATIAVNLTAPFLLAQRTVPGMTGRGFGRVLFVSSVAAFTGGMVGPHYAASKSGLHRLVFWLAKRTAANGVTVNAIAPALVASGMVADDMDAERSPSAGSGAPRRWASRRWRCSLDAYVTGKVFLADGGMQPRRAARRSDGTRARSRVRSASAEWKDTPRTRR